MKNKCELDKLEETLKKQLKDIKALKKAKKALKNPAKLLKSLEIDVLKYLKGK
jgi:hypothetical protein